MKTNQLNETKERKSFKEVLVENKGKLIAISSVTVAVIAGGFYAYSRKKLDTSVVDLLNTELEMHKTQNVINKKTVSVLESLDNDMTVVKQIALEGALEEAIKTVKRKIQFRVTKIAGCIKEGSPEALLSKELYEKELEILKTKLELFEDEWNNMMH